jgi:hypothetical protein
VTATFSSALRPAPYFYGGGGSSDLVPWKFDVAIGGRPYLLDLASNQYQAGWEPRIRDSVDQGNIPGEATISPQGLWRRSQNSWHLGAGQRWADLDDAQYGRFYQSVGLDVFGQRGELSLLRKAEVIESTTATNLFTVQANGRIYWSDGQTLKFSSNPDLSSPTTVTGTAAANITGLATDGFNVFISQGSSGVYKTDSGVTTAAVYASSNIIAGFSKYVKGRLMVAGSSTDKHKLWNITASGNNPTVLYTHPNTNFEWVGLAAGPNHIYAGGFSGAYSIIYRTIVKSDGTGLDTPVVAGELPRGEVLRGLGDYLGFVLIGTNLGVRLASADQNGNLVIGSLIPAGPVCCFNGDGRFVYFGWGEHPSGSAGVGVLDLSEFTGPNTPAYASSYFVEGATGVVRSVELFDSVVAFTILGTGICTETGDLVDEGYLDTGAWVWGIPDPKILAKIDGRHAGLPEADTVRIGVSADDGDFEDCGCIAGRGSPFTTFTPQQKRAFKYDLRVRLLKSSNGVSPRFNRVNARAFVNPSRSQVIRVPLLLHPRVLAAGVEESVNVQNELFSLQALVREAQITTYQDAQSSLRVLIEDVLWIPDNNRSDMRDWAGTAVVTMRSIDD